MSNEVDRLGKRIAQLEETMQSLLETGIGLGHSSFENGRINQYTDGLLGGSFGTQYDGTNGAVSLSSPAPPTPRWTDRWGPMVEPIIGGLKVRWEGFFEGGDMVVAPLGHKEVEVHVSDQSTLTGILFDTLRTTITSARGGEVSIPLPYLESGYYLRLTARTNAGRASQPSTVIGPFVPLKVRQADLGFSLSDIGGNSIFYGPDEPTAEAFGDLWLKETAPGPPPKHETWRWVPQEANPSEGAWVQLADRGASDALASAISAQQAADSKAAFFVQPTEPEWEGADGTAVWVDTTEGNVNKVWDGEQFVIRALGNGAIQPNSLVAKDVIATGTVSAALLEAILILASVIIAGNPNGTHAKLTPEGLYVFREDPVDGIPDEVIRLGTSSDDYFGIVDRDGLLVASIDDTGQGNFSALNVQKEPVFQGRPFTQHLSTLARGTVGYFIGTPETDLGPIIDRVGLAEVNAVLDPDRLYELTYRFTWNSTASNAEARVRTHYTVGEEGSDEAPPVLTSSTEIVPARYYSRGGPTPDYTTAQATMQFRPSVRARHRFLVAVERGSFNPTGELSIIGNRSIEISIKDVGLPPPNTGQFSQGGAPYFGQPAPGDPNTPVQSYFVDLPVSAWETFRGNGSKRTDVPGPVQGWDPSGHNGDGRGYWAFDVPPITGTITDMEFYCYSNHWYYNSGGTAIFNIAMWNNAFAKPMPDLLVPGYPKPGGKTIKLPKSWYPFFKSGQGGTGITVGQSNGTNLTYYGRFAGPSARLRIWYTQ